MVQLRVEWSIVGSAVRRSAIGLRVSYILTEKEHLAHPLAVVSRERDNNRREEHGVPADYWILLVTQPSRHCPSCLRFAAPVRDASARCSNPPTLLSTTTREMVIRYGLEVAGNISLLNDTILPFFSFLSRFLLLFFFFFPYFFLVASMCLNCGLWKIVFRTRRMSVMEWLGCWKSKVGVARESFQSS